MGQKCRVKMIEGMARPFEEAVEDFINQPGVVESEITPFSTGKADVYAATVTVCIEDKKVKKEKKKADKESLSEEPTEIIG